MMELTSSFTGSGTYGALLFGLDCCSNFTVFGPLARTGRKRRPHRIGFLKVGSVSIMSVIFLDISLDILGNDIEFSSSLSSLLQQANRHRGPTRGCARRGWR